MGFIGQVRYLLLIFGVVFAQHTENYSKSGFIGQPQKTLLGAGF
jgi:hypothetical protein